MSVEQGQQQQPVKREKKEKKENPVYKALRGQASITANELRAEWNAGGDAKTKLGNRNRGVRCFMKSPVHDEKEVEDLINEFRVPDSFLQFETETSFAVDVVVEDPSLHGTTMTVLYSPSSSPLDVIYGGLPSEVSDLGNRSTVIWQLKSPALHLSESEEVCKLFTQTSFYLPNVEVRKGPLETDYEDLSEEERVSLDVCMMSDVDAVLKYMTEESREDEINLPKLIYTKLSIPFLTALYQNRNRVKLGLPTIRNLVFGDIGLRSQEFGSNTLFCQQLWRLLDKYDGCFDRVVVCGHPKQMHHALVDYKCRQ